MRIIDVMKMTIQTTTIPDLKLLDDVYMDQRGIFHKNCDCDCVYLGVVSKIELDMIAGGYTVKISKELKP